jgi:hypothetical protein
MSWKPISLSKLDSIMRSELEECSEEVRAFFARFRIVPIKWRQSPWGDMGGGFWAVAVHEGRVLWFNDIECGFNVSNFVTQGEIPENEYWCNQDTLQWAIPRLVGDPGGRFGPPEAIPDW